MIRSGFRRELRNSIDQFLDEVKDVRLYEFDKEEWWDIWRRLNPAITREEYELMFEEMQDAKADYYRAMCLN